MSISKFQPKDYTRLDFRNHHPILDEYKQSVIPLEEKIMRSNSFLDPESDSITSDDRINFIQDSQEYLFMLHKYLTDPKMKPLIRYHLRTVNLEIDMQDRIKRLNSILRDLAYALKFLRRRKNNTHQKYDEALNKVPYIHRAVHMLRLHPNQLFTSATPNSSGSHPAANTLVYEGSYNVAQTLAESHSAN
jgi:hypothetical protein